ncbi:dynamin family protein [Desulfonema ishimotonii]|uniref:Dynamin family protein n=1 Tax=Desulfonema ishimotonii TaxID=45657 RepID=A0A401FZW0_9BACT|nr:dynamin family protein [Desulfonema ishimotonii]GBC62477.1 dynamin family protein [Desulfonema ishimotonii]
MYREKFISSLREEIAEAVAVHLTPVALRYDYCDVPLETNIRWQPMVLIIGNYSSGKSSFINEFLGAKIQDTGQAPTDDSFTVITHDDSVPETEGVQVTEERDGKALLNDPEYPFSTLRKQGERFASHFRLKKVNSPFLRHLAIIDTPGMLDSITERDRGYDYQEVIGDLAQKAGLVLVLFDAHKAGTVREAYKSIRETLSAHTSEDRIIFVLNRIDECASFNDLLRVYGTLCWNLSQITGRKDIPMIRLAYSPNASPVLSRNTGAPEYLPLLENQREDLKKAITETPRRRLDHLAAYVETHSERLGHYLEALLAWRMAFRKFRIQKTFTGFLCSLLGGSLATLGTMMAGLDDPVILAGAGGVATILLMLIWMTLFQKRLEGAFHQKKLDGLDTLTPLGDQTRKDSWEAIRERVQRHLERDEGRYSLFELRHDLFSVRRAHREAAHDIREALSELAKMTDEDFAEWEAHRLTDEAYEAEKKRLGLSDLEILKNSYRHMF